MIESSEEQRIRLRRTARWNRLRDVFSFFRAQRDMTDQLTSLRPENLTSEPLGQRESASTYVPEWAEPLD